MTERTALVLGTNAGQADLIRHLKSGGWKVTACGHRQQGPGVELADRFVQIDIADIDGIASLAEQIGASLVYSVSSDLAVPTYTAVSERLDLPHFLDSERVGLLTDKVKLRRFLRETGLSPVAFRVVDGLPDADGWDRFPCIVKPAVSQGQRGLTLVDDEGGLGEAVDRALGESRSGSAIIEEYLEGVEISANVLVCAGRIVLNELSERLVHDAQYVGIPRGHLIPVMHADQEVLTEAVGLVEAIVRELAVADGVLYFQIKLTPGGPRVVEIAPRLDGCHIWRLLAEARGFDFIALMLNCLMGERVDVPNRAPDVPGPFELQFQQMPPGDPFRSSAFPAPDDALYHEYRYHEGQQIEPINGLLEVVGYYVRRVPDRGTP